MDVAVSSRVVARNGIGRFISECEMAATRTVEELVSDGEELSRELAPEGHKKDPRTVTLQEGMFSRMLSATSGEWGCVARHALPVEFGSAAHPQTGDVTFFWENMDRLWSPGRNQIRHPGAGAQPYLRPAYKIISGKAMAVARSKYPG